MDGGATLDEAAGTAVAGRYYDGVTSRAHRVVLRVRDGHACLEGEAERCTPLNDIRVSERSTHAPRKLTFADEAVFEPDERGAMEALLHATGHRDSTVVWMQQSWRAVLASFAMLVIVLVVGYLFVVPAGAKLVARMLPASVERQLGEGVLKMLDRRVFSPTRLAASRQEELAQAFAQLAPPEDGAPPYRLVFRRSRIGPNAFALPSGDIVLTDELVNLLEDDKAVLATLAHELGHLHERHMTRRLIQGSAVAAVITVVVGDAGSLVAGLPTMALDMRYSRDAEQEADDYAAAMLHRNGIPLAHLERLFATLEGLEKEHGAMPPYLASHPPSAERLARLRERLR
ncbi:M48 family metallopeptidase [Pseudoduganella plicata]|uniref:M48 family metallopeptidase n=1 Tax=Pseudoduganella plicata TaxID=321984 RepID=A0A4P7BDX4_9BURK|nr:M48 family metallopeptidase [Pseudoduganella plicata]QBQ36886.1 M48 family metallopeptidase [Pseudoduganella plicata]GGZ07329.1 peptidase M48 [Pseudoduganella plicata]